MTVDHVLFFVGSFLGGFLGARDIRKQLRELAGRVLNLELWRVASSKAQKGA